MKLFLRCVDAMILAGLCAALIDGVPALVDGELGARTFLLSVGLVVTVAAVLGVLAGAVAVTLPRLVVGAGVGRLLAGVAALILAVPLLELVARLFADPGLALAVALLFAVMVAALAWLLARRSGAPLAWLLAAVVVEQLVFRASRSVSLVERVDPARPALPLLLLGVVSLGGVAVAELIRELVGGTTPRPRWRAGACALAGSALLAGSLLLYPDLYRTPHRMAYLAALLLLGAGLVRLELPGGVRPRALAGALAAVAAVWVAWFVRLPSAIPWELSQGTRLARDVVGEGALFERPFRRFVADLRARAGPERPAAPIAGEKVVKNVLLITVDSLRWDHVGYSGKAAPGATPALDRLAEGSLRFQRAYSHGPFTSLAVPALLWSRYPKDVVFVPLFEDRQLRLWFADELPPGADVKRMFQTQSPAREPHANLAEVLSAAGITTVAVLNDGPTRFLEPRIGMSRGFAVVEHVRSVMGLGRDSRAHSPDSVAADLAIQALSRQGGAPFFLWVHFYEPHAPHVAPAGATRPHYQGEIEHTDAQIGRLLAALREGGHDSSTLVVFTSDHGELFAKSRPEQGIHGVDLREALVRVPLLVRLPGAVPRDVDDVVAHVDLAPTLLTALGVRPPESMQGRDLSPLFHRGRLAPRPAYVETWFDEAGGGARMLHQIAAVSGTGKVVMDLRSYSVAFFDLAADPGERKNLFVAPLDDRFAELAAELVRWKGL